MQLSFGHLDDLLDEACANLVLEVLNPVLLSATRGFFCLSLSLFSFFSLYSQARLYVLSSGQNWLIGQKADIHVLCFGRALGLVGR